MPALRPPGVTMTRLPSTSGDSLISQWMLRPPKSRRMLRCQTTVPSSACRQARSPFSVSTYSRSPSTVGVLRGPEPRSLSPPGPRFFDQTSLAVGAIERRDDALAVAQRPGRRCDRRARRPSRSRRRGPAPSRRTRRPGRRPLLQQAGLRRDAGAIGPAPLRPVGGRRRRARRRSGRRRRASATATAFHRIPLDRAARIPLTSRHGSDSSPAS